MELRHLRYFVAVAQELSFTRAAVRLGVSQPPLGQQIRALEEELGVSLFSRTKRRVALTAAGAALLEEAERTLAQAEAAAEVARRAGRGEVGRLTIGFISSAGFEVLPRVLRPFRERWPDVRLLLRQMPTAAQAAALEEGTLDMAFLSERLASDALEQRVMAAEPLVAVVPSGHPLAVRRTVRLAQLRREAFVIFPREAAPHNYDRIVGLCRDAGFSPRIEQEAQEMQTRVGLVAAGLGVSLLPASARHISIAGAVHLALEDPIAPFEILATWRRSDPSPLLANLLTAATAHP